MDVKLTVPVGATGETEPERVAVRVTESLTLDGPELVTATVGVVFDTVWEAVPGAATVKLTSPE